MRLLLLISLALLVVMPAQALPAHVHHASQAMHGGNPPRQGVAMPGDTVGVAGLSQAPRVAATGSGLSFGDSALPSSPADANLLAAGSWAASDHHADAPQGDQHYPALSMVGYGPTGAEPAGWAVAAAAVLTLLGLLGLRRRAR